MIVFDSGVEASGGARPSKGILKKKERPRTVCGETDEDEGIGNEIEDLRREAAELRQTLADRKRELS